MIVQEVETSHPARLIAATGAVPPLPASGRRKGGDSRPRAGGIWMREFSGNFWARLSQRGANLTFDPVVVDGAASLRQRFRQEFPQASIKTPDGRDKATSHDQQFFAHDCRTERRKFLWESCGNQRCFSLLSRDKCNECPASSVSQISYLRSAQKPFVDFVNRWSGVQISQPAPQSNCKVSGLR